VATLIRNGIVLPMEGRKLALDPGSVLIDGDSIAAVGSVAELDADPRAAGATVVDATDHAVIPGLHNGHLHSGLLRGTAESMSLWDWLEAYVDPAHKALTPEIAEAASMMAYTEGLRFGTTSVMDMWRFMEGSARAAGARVVDATGHAVIPGLHNGHLHSGLLRGTAESLALWDWLKAYVDPAHKALTPEIARAASLSATPRACSRARHR